MMNRLVPPSTSRERALRELREQIANRTWPAGGRLPTETQLASAIGVSRPTIRAALADLEAEGLVENRGHKGRMVSTLPAESSRSTGLMAGTLVVATHRDADALPGDRGGTIDAIESGILDAASARRLNVLRLHRDRFGADTLDWLCANPPTGLAITAQVAYSQEIRELARALRVRGVPVVTNERAPGLEGIDAVVFDHAGGAAALVNWLVARGCRRILPFWTTSERGVAWIEDRERGYRDAMAEAGLEALEPVRCDLPPRGADGDAESLAHRVRHCLGYLYEHVARKPKADALMLLEDSAVYPVVGACGLAGWRIGRGGLRIVGFDDFWANCWERAVYPVPALATVDKQNYLAGQEMVRLLAERASSGAGSSATAPAIVRVPCAPRLP